MDKKIYAAPGATDNFSLNLHHPLTISICQHMPGLCPVKKFLYIDQVFC